MKTLITSLILATSLAGAAHANGYNINTSNNSSCSQNESASTGRSMEFNTKLDTFTNNAQIGFTYRIELGKKKINKIDCNRLFNIEIASQQLKLEKSRMELELLKAQIALTKQNMIEGKPAPAPTANGGSDW